MTDDVEIELREKIKRQAEVITRLQEQLKETRAARDSARRQWWDADIDARTYRERVRQLEREIEMLVGERRDEEGQVT